MVATGAPQRALSESTAQGMQPARKSRRRARSLLLSYRAHPIEQEVTCRPLRPIAAPNLGDFTIPYVEPDTSFPKAKVRGSNPLGELRELRCIQLQCSLRKHRAWSDESIK